MTQPVVPQTLGARLRQARREMAAREHRDVTQSDVAEAIGVSKVQVSRYESDLQMPSLDLVPRIAAFLGVSPGWLAFGPDQRETGSAEAPPAYPPAQPMPAESFRYVAPPEPVARPSKRKRGG